MKLQEFYSGQARSDEIQWQQQSAATRQQSSNKQFYVQTAAGKKYGPFADTEKAYQFAGARKDLGPGTKIVVGAA